MSFINRQDSDRRKELIGAPAALWVQRSRRLWATVVAPLAVLLLACLVLVRVVGVSAAAFGPFIFIVVSLMLLSAVVLPFVSISMLRRASREAAKFLDAERFIGSAKIPTGIVQSRPVVIENYLMRMGIPQQGAFVGEVRLAPTISRRPGFALIVGTLRSTATGPDWRQLIAALLMLLVGTLLALVLAVLEIVRLASGSAAANDPNRAAPVLFVVAIALVAIGAVVMYGAIRRISGRAR